MIKKNKEICGILKKSKEDFFKRLNEIITDIAYQLGYGIADEREKMYFRADMDDNFGGKADFYFNTTENKEYRCCTDIPEMYNVHEKEYYEYLGKVYESLIFLKELFIEYKRTTWKAITIIVDKQMTIKTYYDYTDWLNSPYDSDLLLEYFFKYKYLGEMPKTENQEKLFKEIEKYQKQVITYVLNEK